MKEFGSKLPVEVSCYSCFSWGGDIEWPEIQKNADQKVQQAVKTKQPLSSDRHLVSHGGKQSGVNQVQAAINGYHNAVNVARHGGEQKSS